MARSQPARTQELKPAASKAPAAATRTSTATKPPTPRVSLLPSPRVAAAILAGAEQTQRRQVKTPGRKPASAPAPLRGESSPARPRIEPSTVAAERTTPQKGATISAETPTAKKAAAGKSEASLATETPGKQPITPQAAAEATTEPSASMDAAQPAAPLPGSSSMEPKAEAARTEPEADGGKGEAKPPPQGDVAAPNEDGAPSADGAPGAKLHIPEPPSAPSPATKRRIGGVQRRAGAKASSSAVLPDGQSQVGDARKGVTQPDAEAKAKAQQDLIALIGGQPAPSPEIVKLCERIREVIRNKRPPDEDALAEAKPDESALSAGNQLNSTIEGETQKVEGKYSQVNKSPDGAPAAKGLDVPPQPDAAGTPSVNAKAATPDAVPAENVSLDADAEANKKKIADAGMTTPAADLVQSGPVAEARGAQGELEQAAKQDPAKVLAEQKESLARAEENMVGLQQQALAALTGSRAQTAKGAVSRQQDMIISEASKREKASAEAQQLFTETQKAVTALLQPLAKNALDKWEAAKTLLVSQFKSDLAVVQKRVDERHSGVDGFFVGLWDAATGLPSWAEEAYSKAEYNFSEGVIAKITEISVEVNTVIAACETLIKGARDQIAKIFSDSSGGLSEWAAQEQAKFDQQLDKLQAQAVATRDDFNKNLMDAAKTSVDEVRAEVSDLRKKAGGLVGRIADAVRRFVDDPVKFIIEGLLDLLGIPPAAFWAVVAKIKKVIKDIADDPMKFANNLMKGLADGFGKFFDNFGTHLFRGFLTWLLGDLKGVQVPKDLSLKSIVTFFLQLMGITWPNIRKILVKHIGAKNVALIEKVYSIVSLLIEKGPEGIYEMIKEKLDPQSIVDQVIQLAVDYMVTAIAKQVAARLLLLFNPAGAIIQALEAIYRVLKWIFQNAARIFALIETVVNGIADILAGNTGGFAAAVEKALAMLIPPVIAFIADYFSLGDLPAIVADKVKSMREWILGLIEKAVVWIIEKGKALLAAVGIGKKDEKKEEKEGTPHELAVQEVAEQLSVPPPGEPLGYDAMRAAKEKEAASITALRNESLAAEQVKMKVTFADRSSDAADHDLDFTVAITPNDSLTKNATPIPVPEPEAGLHVVKRSAPFEAVAGESHHVPAKGFGTGVADFLDGIASKLRSGEWQGDPAADAVAKAFESRAADNRGTAKVPGEGLSAILLCPEAHTEDDGVHTIEGSGPVLLALAQNPARRSMVLVKRRTQTKIGGVASYIAVNPQIASWRLFLADIRRSLDNLRTSHDEAPGTETAVGLIMAEAEKEFMDAEESSREFLEDRVVRRTNAVLYSAVGHAYRGGKTTVSAAMDRANDGTPDGRQQALSSLDGHFGSSWAPFRTPINVAYPPGATE